MYAYDRLAEYLTSDHVRCWPSPDGQAAIFHGSPDLAEAHAQRRHYFHPPEVPSGGGLWSAKPALGWSNIVIPDKQALVSDSGKLHVLDGLSKGSFVVSEVLKYSQFPIFFLLFVEKILYLYCS